MAKNIVAYCGTGGAPIAVPFFWWKKALPNSNILCVIIILRPEKMAFIDMSMLAYIEVVSAVNKTAPGGRLRLTSSSLRIQQQHQYKKEAKKKYWVDPTWFRKAVQEI
eukprot:8696060-Ditylum_brightwellii.AAC.1